MIESTDEIISAILKREGSKYTDDPVDRGGPTKYGITLKTLTQYRGHTVTPADVEALTEDEARAIYMALYVTKPHFDQINNQRLRALVVDTGVLHGQPTATILLQRAVGTHADGIWGFHTQAAVNDMDPGHQIKIYQTMLQEREQLITDIVARNPSQAKFAEGWRNRLKEFV